MKDIVRIVHLSSDVQSESYDVTRILCAQRKLNIDFIPLYFFFSSVTLPASAFMSSLSEHDASTPQMTHDLNAMMAFTSYSASQRDNHTPPAYHLKYLKFCSEDERGFYGFGTTCGKVCNDNIFISG